MKVFAEPVELPYSTDFENLALSGEDIWFEAECPIQTIGAWSLYIDGTASSEEFVSPDSSEPSSLEFHVKTLSTQEMSLWVRVYFEQSISDPFGVTYSGGNLILANHSEDFGAGSWYWVKLAEITTTNLSEILLIEFTNSNVRVDKFWLTTSATQPSGFGNPASNCQMLDDEGFEAGDLASENWDFSGDVDVVDFDSKSGQQSVLIHSDPTDLAWLNLPFVLPEFQNTYYVDFFVKPSAIDFSRLDSDFLSEFPLKTAFVKVGDLGYFYIKDELPNGSGSWIQIPHRFYLETGKSKNWVRLSVRIDFASGLGDLYLNKRMVASDVGLSNDVLTSGQFDIRSHSLGDVGLDFFMVSHTNPLFEDNDNDGIPDNYELANFLDITVNDRDLDLDDDGVSNLIEYIDGTTPYLADDSSPRIYFDDFDPVDITTQNSGYPGWFSGFETSEGYQTGLISGQNGWVGSSGSTVSDTQAFYSQQSLLVTQDAAEDEDARVYFQTDSGGVKWVRMQLQLHPGALVDPDTLDFKSSTIFQLNQENRLSVYDGNLDTWVITNRSVLPDQWYRYDLSLDFNTGTWSIYVNDILVRRNIGFATDEWGAFSHITFREIKGAHSSKTRVDNLELNILEGDYVDKDMDGLDDEFELSQFGALIWGLSDDPDNDHVSNGIELSSGSDMSNPDTDGDGIPDGYDSSVLESGPESVSSLSLPLYDGFTGYPIGDFLGQPHFRIQGSVSSSQISLQDPEDKILSIDCMSGRSVFGLEGFNEDYRELWVQYRILFQVGTTNPSIEIGGFDTNIGDWSPVDYSFQNEQWYTVTLHLDYGLQAYEIFIDGIRYGSNQPFDFEAFTAALPYLYRQPFFSIVNSSIQLDDVAVTTHVPDGLDLDYDNLIDSWEENYFGATYYYGGNDDPDGDGLSNSEEFEYGTNPDAEDTDGDLLSDGDEIFYGRDPTQNDEFQIVGAGITSEVWEVGFENVEGYTIGSLNEQNGWTSTGFGVEPNIEDGEETYSAVLDESKYASDQSSSDSYMISNVILKQEGVVYVNLVAKLDRGALFPINDVSAKFSNPAIFQLNPDGYVCCVDHDTEQWINTGRQIQDGAWSTYTMRVDYSNRSWQIYINDYLVEQVYRFSSIDSFDSEYELQKISINNNAQLATQSWIDYISITTEAPDGLHLDGDADGLTDILESQIGTNPDVPDSDGDGFVDGWEYYLANGLDPLVTDLNLPPGPLLIQSVGNQIKSAGSTVFLDSQLKKTELGLYSSAFDIETLWTVVAQPVGANTNIADATDSSTTTVLDVPGLYRFECTLSSELLEYSEEIELTYYVYDSSLESNVVTEALIGSWQLDSELSAGEYEDYSVFSNLAVGLNTPSPTAGWNGNAIQFDGSSINNDSTDKILSVTNGNLLLDGLKEFSLVFWYQAPTVSGTNGVIRGVDSSGDVSFQVELLENGILAPSNSNVLTGELRMSNERTLRFESSSDVVSFGEWSQVVIVFDAVQGKLKLFVNGFEDNGLQLQGDALGVIRGIDSLAFGLSKTSSIGFDGLVDEVSLYARPLSADEIWNLATDMDGDGLPDHWERQIMLFSPSDSIERFEDVDTSADFDGDEFSNLAEFLNNTDPTVADTPSSENVDADGDDLADDWELSIVKASLFDNINTISDVDPDGDFDGDGLSNLAEYLLGSNPLFSDSDGDGVDDLSEKRVSTDPLDPTEFITVSPIEPWKIHNIGNADAPSDGFKGNQNLLYLTGYGAGIGSQSESMSYFAQEYGGAISITAKVYGMGNWNDSQRLGIMIRDSIANPNIAISGAIDKHANLLITEKVTQASDTVIESVQLYDEDINAIWLRVSKMDARMAIYTSLDGETWRLQSETYEWFPNPLANFFVGFTVFGNDLQAAQEATVEIKSIVLSKNTANPDDLLGVGWSPNDPSGEYHYKLINKATGRVMSVRGPSDGFAVMEIQHDNVGDDKTRELHKQWKIHRIDDNVWEIQSAYGNGWYLNAHQDNPAIGNVYQWGKTNHPLQRWTLWNHGDYYFVANMQNWGKVLTVQEGHNYDGNSVVQQDQYAASIDAQLWEIERVGDEESGIGGIVFNGDYKLKLHHTSNSKAMTVRNASPYENEEIIQQTVHDTPAQLYEITNIGGEFHYIKSKVSGMALTVPNNQRGDVNIVQQKYVGAQNQHWRFILQGDTYRIVNQYSGKVLEVANGTWTELEPIRQNDDAGTDHQRFQIEEIHNAPVTPDPIEDPTPGGPGDPGDSDDPVDNPPYDLTGTYSLVNRYSGKALDVSGFSHDNHAKIMQWDWNGYPNQKFKFEYRGEGYYSIKPQHTQGKALDVFNFSENNGAEVVQWEDSRGNATNQLWEVKKLSGGFYKFIAKHSGKALEISYTTLELGASATQWSQNSHLAQEWKLVTGDPPNQSANLSNDLPGRIQFEDYDKGGLWVAYNDRSISNVGSKYRDDGVDIANRNGQNVVMLTNLGEWMEYTIADYQPGTYDITINYTSRVDGARIRLFLKDQPGDGGLELYELTEAVFPKTNSDTDFNILLLQDVFFSSTESSHPKIVIEIEKDGAELNWFEVAGEIDPDDTDSDGMSDEWERQIIAGIPTIDSIEDFLPNGNEDDDNYTNKEEFLLGTDPLDPNDPDPLSPVVDPFDPAPPSLPGQLQVENFDLGGYGLSYYEVGNNDPVTYSYRDDAPDVDFMLEANGVVSITNFEAGEWLKYSIPQISGGFHDISIRCAAAVPTKLGLYIDDNHIRSIHIPVTGALNNWTHTTLYGVKIPTVTAPRLELRVEQGEMSIDWVQFNPVSDYFTDPNQKYALMPGHVSNRYLDAFSASSGGTNIVQYHSTNSDNQYWKLQRNGDGYFHIVNAYSGNAVDIEQRSTSNDANVQQAAFQSNHESQQWEIGNIGNQRYYIINRKSGLALHVANASTEIGNNDPSTPGNIVQHNVNYYRHQQWSIEPFTDQPQQVYAPLSSSRDLSAISTITIHAEEYDTGGLNKAYYDSSAGNSDQAFRDSEGVDIGSIPGGGYCVTNTESGEWMEFTIANIPQGHYRINARVASNSVGGSFQLQWEGRPDDASENRMIHVPHTGGMNQFRNVTLHNVYIEEGGTDKVLRVYIKSGGFALDSLSIHRYANNPFDESKYHLFKSFNSAFALDAFAYNRGPNNNLAQFQITQGTNQYWKVNYLDNGFFKISSKMNEEYSNELVVGVQMDQSEYGNGLENHANIKQLVYDPSAHNQQWEIVEYEGRYSFIARHSGRAMDVFGHSQRNGGSIGQDGNVVQWDFYYNHNQQWEVYEETPSGSQSPFGGQLNREPNVRVEAEDFDIGGLFISHFDYRTEDEDSDQMGGSAATDYRASFAYSVDVFNGASGRYVGSTNVNEWMEYTFKKVSEGEHRIDISLSAAQDSSVRIDWLVGGSPIATGRLENLKTNNSNDFQTFSIPSINLGNLQNPVMRLTILGGKPNIDYIEIEKLTTPAFPSPAFIKAKASNPDPTYSAPLTLDVLAASQENGSPDRENTAGNVIAHNQTATQNQMWEIEPIGSGYYQLKPGHATSKRLAGHSNPNANGDNVFQTDLLNVNYSTRWYIDRKQIGGVDYYRFKNVDSEQFLNVVFEGAPLGAGYNVVQAAAASVDDANYAQQLWRIDDSVEDPIGGSYAYADHRIPHQQSSYIQAEAFDKLQLVSGSNVSYNDTDSANSGGAFTFRSDENIAVDVSEFSDLPNQYYVTDIRNGEFLRYSLFNSDGTNANVAYTSGSWIVAFKADVHQSSTVALSLANPDSSTQSITLATGLQLEPATQSGFQIYRFQVNFPTKPSWDKIALKLDFSSASSGDLMDLDYFQVLNPALLINERSFAIRNTTNNQYLQIQDPTVLNPADPEQRSVFLSSVSNPNDRQAWQISRISTSSGYRYHLAVKIPPVVSTDPAVSEYLQSESNTTSDGSRLVTDPIIPGSGNVLDTSYWDLDPVLGTDDQITLKSILTLAYAGYDSSSTTVPIPAIQTALGSNPRNWKLEFIPVFDFNVDGDALPDSLEQQILEAFPEQYSSINDIHPNDDPDNDGIPNFVEFISGTDPAIFTTGKEPTFKDPHTDTFHYDVLGRLEGVGFSGGGYYFYHYDANGNITSVRASATEFYPTTDDPL